MAESAVRRTEEEVADLVGAVTESDTFWKTDAAASLERTEAAHAADTPPPTLPAAQRARPRRIRDARRQRETNAGRGPIGDPRSSRSARASSPRPRWRATRCPACSLPSSVDWRATCCSSRIRDWPCAGSSRTPTARCQAASSPEGRGDQKGADEAPEEGSRQAPAGDGEQADGERGQQRGGGAKRVQHSDARGGR